jgi:radical SAM superfamily enzyme YgiQ (UPF0313 family)
MEHRVYLIQPSYRTAGGGIMKKWNTFSNCLNLPILSAVIPGNWEKETCFEFFDEINYNSSARVIIISYMGFDIVHTKSIIESFKQKGKIVILACCQDSFSNDLLGKICDSVFKGYPNHKEMEELLLSAMEGKLQKFYQFRFTMNFSFDYSILQGKKIGYMPVYLGAGCKNDCSYCCTAGIFNGKYYLRKIDYVLNDLRSAIKIKRMVGFFDSNIYNNREYLIRLCNSIIKNKLKFIWGGQVTVDIGNDPEVLDLMKRAGCKILFLGLETLNNNNLDSLNKFYSADHYRQLVSNIRQKGFYIVGYFMFGLDYDTKETFNHTLNFIRSSQIHLPLFNILIPAPGTKLYQDLKSENRLVIKSSEELEEENPIYSVPCNRCLFLPKNLSVKEAEKYYMEFAGKASSLKEIARRSIVLNPLISFIILYTNLHFRRIYRRMR